MFDDNRPANPIIKVKRLSHGAGLELPSYETALAAGADIRAAVPENEPMIIRPGERCMTPTGIAIALPEGGRRRCAHALALPRKKASRA